VGQGYNSFTLLQLAQATSTLANDGLYIKPHLVRQTVNTETGESSMAATDPPHQLPIDPAHIKVVKDALADVIKSGTARRAFAGAAYNAAGKTGTAQVFSLRGSKYRASAIDERLRDHALFMSYAPANDPEIAIALIVENAGWGATQAAPIARRLYDYWLEERKKS